jgi:hypothetical protein
LSLPGKSAKRVFVLVDPAIHLLRNNAFYEEGWMPGSSPGMTKMEAATLLKNRGRRWMIASHPLNRTTVL